MRRRPSSSWSDVWHPKCQSTATGCGAYPAENPMLAAPLEWAELASEAGVQHWKECSLRSEAGRPDRRERLQKNHPAEAGWSSNKGHSGAWKSAPVECILYLAGHKWELALAITSAVCSVALATRLHEQISCQFGTVK